MEKLNGKVLILNAPKGAGKDTVAEALRKLFPSIVEHRAFKDRLYIETARHFNLPLQEVIDICSDEVLKEEPNIMFSISSTFKEKMCEISGIKPFGGFRSTYPLSPREALIFVSEILIKPSLGNEFFGQALADALDLEKLTVVSDGGFDEELFPVVRALVKPSDLIIVKFTGQNSYDFLEDSRDWLKAPEGVKTIRLTNDGTVEEFIWELTEKLEDIFTNNEG